MRKTKEEYKKIYIEIINLYKTGLYTVTDLAIKYNMCRHNVSRKILKEKLNINLYNKKAINSNIFSVIDTEEKAYWLGFLYADGNVAKDKRSHVELSLCLKDELHLLKYLNFLNYNNIVKKDTFRCRVVFSDIQIKQDLIKLGCIPKKSLILTFPNYSQVPKQYTKHFVRGYIDGDGSIYTSKPNYNCHLSILGTKEFLEDLIQTLNLPIRKLYKNSDRGTNVFFIEYSGNNCLQIIDFLYKDSSIYLDRKYNKYLEIKDAVFNGNIRNYERVNSVNPTKVIKFMGNTELT